jgi:hypothetical protein
MKAILFLCVGLSLLVACHPRIYSFTVDPKSIGPGDPIRVSWEVKGQPSLQIRDYPYPGDSNTGDKLRYITLVVTRNHQEISQVVQVAVRSDSATDEIAFRPVISGDSLVAAGVNNPVRWGDHFDILSVTDGGSRVMEVSHAGITRELRPGDKPEDAFKGTPVQGDWTFRCQMTPEEKNHQRPLPVFLRIFITIKHH